MFDTINTVASDTEALPALLVPFERRGEIRSRTVYRLVHIEHGGDEGLACCRNISDSGMKLELCMPVIPGGMIKVTFSADHTFAGKIIWAQGRECGVAFVEAIDSLAVLRESTTSEPDPKSRALRLKSAMPAKVSFDGKTHETVVSGLSQKSLILKDLQDFRAGLHVSVMVGAGYERRGVVCWRSDHMAELILLEPFTICELGSANALAAS